MARVKDYKIRITEQGAKRVKSELSGVDRVTNRLSATLKNVALGFGAAFSVQAIGRHIIETASQFENLRVRLVALYGDVNAANQAFETFRDIAATTPFAVKEVVEAGATLKAFGLDAEENIKILSDLAAFMGTSMVDAANAMGRAFAGGAGAADIFRERGVLAMIKTSQAIDDFRNLSLKEFRKAMFATFQDPESGVQGATDLLADTFTGAVSNLSDQMDELAASIGEGLLPQLKDTASELENISWYIRQAEGEGVVGFIERFRDAIVATALPMAIIIGGLKTFNQALQQHITEQRSLAMLTEITNDMWEEFGRVRFPEGEEIIEKVTEKTDKLNFSLKTEIENLQIINRELSLMSLNFEEVEQRTVDLQIRTDPVWDAIRLNAEKLGDVIRVSLIQQFREGEGFIKNFQRAFIAALEAMAAEILARSAIWLLLNYITGGAGVGFQSFTQFALGNVIPQSGSPGGPNSSSFQRSGGGTNIYINAVDAKSFEQMLRENDGGRIIRQIASEV